MILDVLAILAWGILLIRYWFNSQLLLLIHPNYFSLVLGTGIILLILGIWQILPASRRKFNNTQSRPKPTNLGTFPPGWGSALLLFTAILGFVIGPNFLSSQTALHRGVRDSLPLTQSQVQQFQVNSNPEERSLIEWVRTLNAYPEPDAYDGQPVNVTGFVIHDPQLPDNYLLVARFIITCCAVDAYSVVIPVELGASRVSYPPDSWITVKGVMSSQELIGERKLVIKPTAITPTPTPKDPYGY
jgi:putative membrane protein